MFQIGVNWLALLSSVSIFQQLGGFLVTWLTSNNHLQSFKPKTAYSINATFWTSATDQCGNRKPVLFSNLFPVIRFLGIPGLRAWWFHWSIPQWRHTQTWLPPWFQGRSARKMACISWEMIILKILQCFNFTNGGTLPAGRIICAPSMQFICKNVRLLSEGEPRPGRSRSGADVSASW